MLGEQVHQLAILAETCLATSRFAGIATPTMARWCADGLAGLGIAYKSKLDVQADLKEGRLVTLCPDWQG